MSNILEFIKTGDESALGENLPSKISPAELEDIRSYMDAVGEDKRSEIDACLHRLVEIIEGQKNSLRENMKAVREDMGRIRENKNACIAYLKGSYGGQR